jgi:hypothetical protein
MKGKSDTSFKDREEKNDERKKEEVLEVNT